MQNNYPPSFYVKQLGTLRICEVFDYYDGPKVYSVTNALNNYYFVFWADEVDNIDTWLYVPVSLKRLRQIRLGVISIRDAIINSEIEVAYFVLQNKKFEFVSIDETSSKNIEDRFLPPAGDYLEHEYEKEYVTKELDQDLGCFLRLKFWKNSNSNVNLSNVTNVLDSFKDYLLPLLKTYGYSDGLIPLSASKGSFVLNLGMNKGDELNEVLTHLVEIISDSNIERISWYLRENKIDPSTVFQLIDSINKSSINLDILTSDNEDARYEGITTLSPDSLSDVRDVLEYISQRFLSSIDVPQADDILRIFELLELTKTSSTINAETLGVVQRQISYYKQAARILYYFDKDNNLTNLGNKVIAAGEEERIELSRIQFETSNCGWAWLNWAGANSLYEVDIDSSTDFILACAPSLSESTARRRAQTLRSWHRILIKESSKN